MPAWPVIASRKPSTILPASRPVPGRSGRMLTGRRRGATPPGVCASTTGPAVGDADAAARCEHRGRAARQSRPRSGRLSRDRLRRVVGHERQRALAQRPAGAPRQGQPELRALAEPAPRLQPAAVQVGVLERDGEPEAGAAAGPRPGRVGPPEPVEDHRRLPRRQADAVVAHRDRGRLLVAGDRTTIADVAGRLGVVDRVGDQVAHDPLHPSYVGLGEARVVRARRPRRGCRAARPARRVWSTTRWATSTRLTSSSSSTAAPASKRLISSRSTSSVSNRSSSVCSSSAARAGRRVEGAAGVVQHVAGHPHGGERRAQLVGHVGDEPPLHPAQLLELADLPLQVGGHLVERRRQPRQVVLAGDAQALLELAGGQPLGDPAGHPHRGHHLPGDQPGQPGDQQQQQHRRR